MELLLMLLFVTYALSIANCPVPNNDVANNIVNQFQTFLAGGPNTQDIAEQLLTPNVVEYSDSVLQLEGNPPGGPSLVGRDAAVANAQGFPKSGFETYDVVYNCNNIVWYWILPQGVVGTGKYEVKGFNLFHITNERQISELDFEFNSIAWAVDTGFKVYDRNGTQL